VGTRVQAQRDEEDREIRRVTAQGMSNPSAIADGNNTTRATTNTANYAGRSVLVDLGDIFTVSRVIQIHDPDPKDFPGRYKIEVTEVTDGSAWREVGRFQGRNGRSEATFAPVRARLLRITAIANHDPEHWWSIYRLRVRG
jgi:hypothetical protein